MGATSSALLGLTLGCAQCHNHKFDPITQRDYYRFQGFFIRGQMNNLVLKDPAFWAEYEAAIPAHSAGRAVSPGPGAAGEGRAQGRGRKGPHARSDREGPEGRGQRALIPRSRRSLRRLRTDAPEAADDRLLFAGDESVAGRGDHAGVELPLPYRPDELKQRGRSS